VVVAGAAVFPLLPLSNPLNEPAIERCPAPPSSMQFSLESLAALATIAGLIVSIFALFQSRAWLALTSFLVVCLATGAVLYARKQRLAVARASTVIEGQSIDSLNIANLKRRVNRTFVVQEAKHTARIEGKNLEITWKYSGYCRAARASTMEFSIDSEARTSFGDLDCSAYDLGHDPEMVRQIRPLLIGTDGISKKISVPLLEPVSAREPFGVLLKCTLPRCLPAGSGYYTTTLSFAQDRVPRYEARLIFVGTAPSWVRVYDCTPPRPPTLVKTLAQSHHEPGLCEYIDVVEDAPGQSARVYMFWRDSV